MADSGPAVVTGAAQGIGRRIAEVLAARGHDLVLVDVAEPAATAAAITGAGGTVTTVVGDVADPDVATTVAEAAGPDVAVLVNNAGISLIRPAEETTPAEFRRVLEVNLLGPFLLCRALARPMLARRAGSVVNVSSVAGLLAVGDRAAYNASKSGLIGLTRTLAAEWGGRGVRVNAVCPGWVKTEMDVADQAGGGYVDADITGRVPMGRFATPDDIAGAVAYLSDPAQSGFVNGHALSVDGGWFADASWESLRLRHR